MASTSVVRDITVGLETEVATETGYSKLKYVEQIEENSFNNFGENYSIRPLASFESPGSTKTLTSTQTFEVVLTSSYIQSAASDSSLQTKKLDMYEKMLDTVIRIEKNKAGVPASVLNINNLAIQEPQVLFNQKVVVLTATIDVLYRINL